jgi:hypothetical protein
MRTKPAGSTGSRNRRRNSSAAKAITFIRLPRRKVFQSC